MDEALMARRHNTRKNEQSPPAFAPGGKMKRLWDQQGELILALTWALAACAVGAYWIITGDDYGAALGMLLVCVPLVFD